MIKLGDKRKDREIDKNFFKQMNYEIAAEHGVIDNEDMKNNRKLNDWERGNSKNSRK